MIRNYFENTSRIIQLKNTFYLVIILAGLIACGPVVKHSESNPANLALASKGDKPFANIPDKRDVTIYQVNMRTFSEEGDFKGVTKRLDSIHVLGANVIYLMPHYALGKIKSVNSPYCIRDYKTVNEEFGNLDDLRDLVRSAHDRNMAVTIDWVANHTSYDHLWTHDPSWYLNDASGKIISPPNMGWNDVAQLNFQNKDMRLAMIDAMKYWVEAVNIDGFRCDYADGPPVDFWKQALDTLYAMPGRNLLMLAEGSRAANFSAGFHYNFGFRFFGNLKAIFERGRPVSSIDSMNRLEYAGANEMHRIVRYITNHDVNGSDGTPQELFGNMRGAVAAFVVAAYMKGVPMIYNGQEVGTPYRLVFPFTSANIDWSLNSGLTSEYKKLIAFRNESAAIRRGELFSFGTSDVCAFTKKTAGEEVLVFVNMRNQRQQMNLPASLQKTSWTNGVNNTKLTIADNYVLEPYEYLILKRSL